MPPSGYPSRDAEIIAAFLQSCVNALEAEVANSGRGILDALSREIAGINSVLSKHEAEPFAMHTLLLTRAFYERLADRHPGSVGELKRIMASILKEVVSQITSVHVEEHSFT